MALKKKKHFQLGDMKKKIKTGRTPLVGSRLGYQTKGQKNNKWVKNDKKSIYVFVIEVNNKDISK